MESTVNGIILCVQSERMGDTSRIEIFGKTMLDWVSLSLGNNHVETVAYSEGDDIPILVRSRLDPDIPETVILFSDTPLITKQTVFDAVADLRSCGKNVIKLTRGYVASTSYLLRTDKIYTQKTHYFEVDDFVTAFSYKQIALISDILKNRILDYHMERGVRFSDPSSTYIDSDVSLGKGAVIGQNNVIKGKTHIKENARILSNNVIDTCIIDEGATVECSHISDSYIGKNSVVGPYAHIFADSIIGASCRIGAYSEIEKSVVEDGLTVEPRTNLSGEKKSNT